MNDKTTVFTCLGNVEKCVGCVLEFSIFEKVKIRDVHLVVFPVVVRDFMSGRDLKFFIQLCLTTELRSACLTSDDNSRAVEFCLQVRRQ